jgi:iron complex outermembrane recepter protein
MRVNAAIAAVWTAFALIPAAQTFAQSRAVIEEIVVTATKREESVQDIPIAVSAYTGESLTHRGITDVAQLQQVSPSLLVNTSNSTTNGGTMRIRGIGTTGNNVGLEAAVGFFQDGAYRSRSGQALNELVDVQRVEVLRGPQGTLFGRNTSAGAVHVISNAPEFDFGGNFAVGAGNMSSYKVEGMVTGPVVDDQLAFRLAGMWSQRDGHFDDLARNDKYDDRDRYTLKGQLLWTPTDTFDARLIVDYMHKDESCCPAAFKEVGATGAILRALGGTTVVSRSGDVGVNHKPFEEVDDWGIGLELTWDLGWATFTSVTSYREFEVDRGQDVDFTDVNIYQVGNTEETFDNWSQELRLAGATDNLDWLVGVFFSGEEIKNTGRFLVLDTQGPDYFALLFNALIGVDPNIVRALLNPGDGLSAAFDQDASSWAIFTNNTWRMTERWSVNFGLRYTEEDKKGGSLINETGTAGVVDNNWPCAFLPVATFCNNAGYRLRRSEQQLTGTLKLAYAFSDNVTGYAGWSNGYKAGGFNLDPTAFKLSPAGEIIGDGREFEEETVDAWEVGLKTASADGRVTVNTALFYSRFEDFQLNTFTGAFFVVDNVPEVITKGAEVEFNWVALDGVVLNGGVTYADARYEDDTPIVNATAPFGGPTNLEGKRVTNSPLWQSSLGVFVDRPLPLRDGFNYTANVSWMFRSSHNTGSDLDPQKHQGSYGLVNAQIGVRTVDDRLEALLWSTNLFDKQYRPLTFDSVSQTGSWHTFTGVPRLWGVTLRGNF